MQACRKVGIGDALCLIIQEHLFKSQGCAFVEEKDISLEIVFKRTEVDIRGATGGQRIVDNHEFGMQETTLIEEHLGTSLVELAQVRA